MSIESVQPHLVIGLIAEEEDIDEVRFKISAITNHPYIVLFIPDGELFQTSVETILEKFSGYKYIPATMLLRVYGRGTVVFFYHVSMDYYIKKIVPKAFVDKVYFNDLFQNILRRLCVLSSDILFATSRERDSMKAICNLNLHKTLDINLQTKPISYVRNS